MIFADTIGVIPDRRRLGMSPPAGLKLSWYLIPGWRALRLPCAITFHAVGVKSTYLFTLQKLPRLVQFFQARFSYRRILQVHRLQFCHDDVGHRRVSEPFVVGGNDVPRRPLGARLTERLFEGFTIIVPVPTLVNVSKRELPILFRRVEPRQKPFALLLF